MENWGETYPHYNFVTEIYIIFRKYGSERFRKECGLWLIGTLAFLL
jgi:hypothetical protein